MIFRVGEFMYELVDSITGESLAYLDLAWPEGVQENIAKSSYLNYEDQETLGKANKAGYRCFTTTDEFKQYIRSEIYWI